MEDEAMEETSATGARLESRLPSVPRAPTRRNGVDAFTLTRTALDGYAARILVSIHEREASALEPSRRCGLPLVACYRRLRRLEDLGLIAVVRVVQLENGHRIQLFLSRVRALRLMFENGRLRVRI